MWKEDFNSWNKPKITETCGPHLDTQLTRIQAEFEASRKIRENIILCHRTHAVFIICHYFTFPLIICHISIFHSLRGWCHIMKGCKCVTVYRRHV
uniref:Uncharacterized protein n=1 Tax=Arundo donax TaxID=35708 RepID=A0A0A9F2C8_ARUDO